MNDKFDEDYMEHLRGACYTCGVYVDMRKAPKGATQDEIKEWASKEIIRLKPIKEDNYIALHGTDEEVIELAKRICPEQLESPSITLIT